MHAYKSESPAEPAEGRQRPKVLTGKPCSAEAAELVRGAMKATGAAQRPWAGALGMARSMPGKWCSHAYDESPSLRRILQTIQARPRLGRELARRIWDKAQATVPTSSQCLSALLMLKNKELGEYAGRLHEAMLDGELSVDELDDLIREGTDVLELVEVTLRTLRAMREGHDG